MSVASKYEADLTNRVRLSIEHNDSVPYGAWSTGERLAVALVLRDREYLSAEGETESSVLSRIGGDIRGNAAEARALIERVRATTNP